MVTAVPKCVQRATSSRRAARRLYRRGVDMPTAAAAAGHDDRGPGRRADRRRAGAGQRLLRHRLQRPDDVHAGHRPQRRAGGPPLQPAAPGRAADDPVRRGGGAARPHPGLRLRRDRGRTALHPAAAGAGIPRAVDDRQQHRPGQAPHSRSRPARRAAPHPADHGRNRPAAHPGAAGGIQRRSCRDHPPSLPAPRRGFIPRKHEATPFIPPSRREREHSGGSLPSREREGRAKRREGEGATVPGAWRDGYRG